MLFRKQKRTDIRELNLRISNDAIQPVDDFNFLGLHINSKLNWETHTNVISKRMSRAVGVIKKLQLVFPKTILLTIYNALILPHINYCLLHNISNFYQMNKTNFYQMNKTNFYQMNKKFVYEHIAYSSAEQAFQHKKARVANDLNMQREIMFNADPVTQKLLGQEITGLNKEDWNNRKRHIMKDILVSKFTQDPGLRELLLQTGTKKLAEANARDNYFAIGMPLTHPEVLDSTKWSENGNQLGEILMELRVELST